MSQDEWTPPAPIDLSVSYAWNPDDGKLWASRSGGPWRPLPGPWSPEDVGLRLEDVGRIELLGDTTSFDVWETDEPEFAVDAPHKFDMLLHPLRMALGTGGKNDHLAKEGVFTLAAWAQRKLFVACLKVCWWCGVEIVRRFLDGDN